MSIKINPDEIRKAVVNEDKKNEEVIDNETKKVEQKAEGAKEDTKEVKDDASTIRTQAQGIGQVPLPGPGTVIKK